MSFEIFFAVIVGVVISGPLWLILLKPSPKRTTVRLAPADIEIRNPKGEMIAIFTIGEYNDDPTRGVGRD